MSSDELRRRVVDELRTLPTGAVLEWGDDTSAEGRLASDLLIWVPELARPLGLNWVWAVADREPADGIGPLSIVLAAQPGGWNTDDLCEVLREWGAVHAGRGDISFRYVPALFSDLYDDMLDRMAPAGAGGNADCVEAPDRRLHSVALRRSADGRAMTECGKAIGEGWTPHDGTLWFPVEMSDEEFDAEWNRTCC